MYGMDLHPRHLVAEKGHGRQGSFLDAVRALSAENRSLSAGRGGLSSEAVTTLRSHGVLYRRPLLDLSDRRRQAHEAKGTS